MKIKNAVPSVFYGMHFEDGVAEYKESDPPQMIYISGETAKKMDKTYQGKPVYVLHNSDAKHDNVQESDGLVVRSFFNKTDGRHWAEFVVFTDAGHEAIKKGWTLSNAYNVLGQKGSGMWHGVEYDYEVSEGSYDHLAIVPNPRYSDSVILTPEQFKQYNLDKEAELIRLANSKGDKVMKLSFFKKQKVENAGDLENMSVVLPESKREVTITQLINEADLIANGKGKANMGDKVDLENGEDISVKELVNFYKANKKKNEGEEEEDKKENEGEEEEEDKKENTDDMDEDDKKENEDGEEEEKENEDEEDEGAEEKQNKKQNKKANALEVENAKLKAQVEAMKKKNFELLKNAPDLKDEVAKTIETSTDQVARGKSRYGSK